MYFLHSRGINAEPMCKVCGDPLEDMSHLFFNCKVAKTFWRDVRHHNHNPTTLNMDALDNNHWMDYWQSIKHEAHTLRLT